METRPLDYKRIFNETTTARHIVFVYSLLQCIDRIKQQLKTKFKSDQNSLTRAEKNKLNFLNQKGSVYIMIRIFAKNIEIIIDKRVHDLFSLTFKGNASPDKSIDFWNPIVHAILPLCSPETENLTKGLNVERAKKCAITVSAILESIVALNEEIYKEFSKNVLIDKNGI